MIVAKGEAFLFLCACTEHHTQKEATPPNKYLFAGGGIGIGIDR